MRSTRWILPVVAIVATTGTIAALLGDRAFSSKPTAADEGLGYRGAISIGMHLDLPGAHVTDRTFELGTAQVTKPRVLIDTVLSGPSCTQEQRSLGQLCPATKRALLRFFVSALLDYRTAVPIAGQSRAVLVRRGEGSREATMPIDLPRFAPGRHCLLVAVLQWQQDSIRGRFRQLRTSGAFMLQVGRSSKDHCVAPPISRTVERRDLAVRVGCGEGVLSAHANRLTLNRRVRQGTILWAYAPHCARATTAVFAVDGRLQPAGGILTPFKLPPGARRVDQLARLPILPRGSYNELFVEDDGAGITATVGEGVLVE